MSGHSSRPSSGKEPDDIVKKEINVFERFIGGKEKGF